MLFAVCGLATLTGAIYAGYLIADEFVDILNSHSDWIEVGKAILTATLLCCAAVTSLHSLAHVWF